ncbi:MAG: hypothetical protein JSV42_06540 [Chloroflexota bacterium]|nr:MAG: hypothetical protein JSV42_06540 [Chloroflexota bacterium]
MNEIRLRRLLISAMITLVVLVIIEYNVERVIGNFLFAGAVDDWYTRLSIPSWAAGN